MRPPLLDQLVHNRTELGIWQELARFDKRQEIANAAHVHPRTLDAFTAAKCAAIDVVHAHFPPPGVAGPGADGPGAAGPGAYGAGPGAYGAGAGADGVAHGANLIRVIHFARIHVQFFADEEVAGLLAASWRSR
jgi:hypothetical protein